MSVFEEAATQLKDSLGRCWKDGVPEVGAVIRSIEEVVGAYQEKFDGAGLSLGDLVNYALKETVRDRLMGEESVTDVVTPVLDATLQLALEKGGDPAIPLEIVEDVAAQTSVASAGELWSLLEERRDRLLDPTFLPLKGNPRSKLSLLRTANSLLRRLPQLGSSAMELRGRILVFLAYVMPLSERSGVNVTGKFNTDNVTRYEEPGDDAGGDVAAPTDYALYRSFWRLQSFLMDPTQLLSSVENWTVFREDVESTLQAWEHRSPSTGAAARPADGGAELAEAAPAEGAGELVGVKYLTSRRLFGLQLADASLQRHVLVQLLILFRFLLASGSGSAPGVEPATAVPPLERRVSDLLRGSGPDGETFVRSVQLALERESRWVQWKADSCPTIERAAWTEPDAPEAAGPKRTKRGRGGEGGGEGGGEEERDGKRRRMWLEGELEGDLDTLCRQESRIRIPRLDDFAAELRTAFDPSNPFADPDMGPHMDKGWVWRGTRLLAVEAPELLEKLLKESFADVLMDKYGIEKPAKAGGEEEKKMEDETDGKE